MRVNEFEQQQLLTVYGKLAQSRCNHCRQPIFIDEFAVQDPKGGFYPKDDKAPSFAPAKPKVEYHRKCNDIRLGKQPKDYPLAGLAQQVKKGGLPPTGKNKTQARGTSAKQQKAIDKAIEEVKGLLKRKPRKRYWNKGRIGKLLFKKKQIKKQHTSKAIKLLLADGTIAKHGLYYSLNKK